MSEYCPKLCSIFLPKWKFCQCLEKILKNRTFPVVRYFTWKLELVSNILWRIVGTELQLKMTFFIFCTKFDQKRYFRSKMEKVNTTIEFHIFKLVYVPNFSSSWRFLFFVPNLPKNANSSQKQEKWTSSLNSVYLN